MDTRKNDSAGHAKLLDENSSKENSSKVNPGDNSSPLPPCPDGGWGWLVVAASFYIHGMIDGLFSVFGVFLPQFLDYFGSSRAKTAVIGSLISAFLLMTGPVASILVSALSCRKVAIIGALLISGGLVLSTIAPTIDVLILTFGVVSGLGLGLIFLPGVVIVGFWFEKKRALAMGLASSGAGLGMLALAPVSGILLEYFDWKNALVLISGIMLQGVVCGALLRPVEFSRKPKFTAGDATSEEKEPPNPENLQPKILKQGTNVEPEFFHTEHRIRTSSLNNHDRAMVKGYKPKNPVTCDVKNEEKIHFSSLQQIDTNHPPAVPSNPLLRKDIFYSGSIQNINKRRKSGSILHQSGQLSQNKDSLAFRSSSVAQLQEKHVSSKCCGDKNYFQVAISMLSVHILKDPAFIVICLANSLAQGGYVLCVYFTTDYGISLGIGAETASYLVSAYGIGTTAGRFTAGLMVAVPWFKPEYVTSVSLMLAGLFAIASAAFCNNFISLALCTGMTGLFIAPIVPLTSVMSVDYLGLENLTNAHGMVSVGKGITSMITAPLAGLLQDVTGSYSPPFYLAGAIFISAGILHLMLPIINRRKLKQRKKLVKM